MHSALDNFLDRKVSFIQLFLFCFLRVSANNFFLPTPDDVRGAVSVDAFKVKYDKFMAGE